MIDLYMICADFKNASSNLRKKSNTIIFEIYKILNSPTQITSDMIRGWKNDFRYIYGDVKTNLASNNKLNAEEVLERYGVIPEEKNKTEQIQLLFYAIQSYFSVLIKSLMKEILCPDDEIVSEKDIILGNFAKNKGIENYCNPDWYCWPIFEMNNGFSNIMKSIRNELSGYQSAMNLEEFVRNNNCDYIKQMYEVIIPRELRHALGEYYTPDWLAEETILTTLSFGIKNVSQRFIDPTCGSGTFLFKVISEKRKHKMSVHDILNTVCGIDINPLAVLTAKTNYLLAILDLITPESGIEIPVYHSDIVRMDDISAPEAASDLTMSDEPEKVIRRYMNDDRLKVKALEKADVILGNPPWVNWEYMSEEYRTGSSHLWLYYNLFSAKGRDLSFSKEDISVLITYIVIDKLLKDGGILAFVIRQGVFKSAQNGVGFRRFYLKDECGIQVLRADDLSNIRAFDNTINSTALIYLKKGWDTVYPVPYFLWEKRKDLKKLSFNGYSELREVKGQITLIEQKAKPAVREDHTSVWLTADAKVLESMDKVLGKNQYKARTGVFTGGANAVYWLNIKNKVGENIRVSNITERAKRKAEKVERTIEPDYVFPMLKGSGVKRWNVSYNTYLLCPHTAETKMWPVSQDILKRSVPQTYEYLYHFKSDLDGRKGFAGWEKEIQEKEFHAILRIGDYTFSKYKVIWKYIAPEFVCAVISSVDDEFLGEKILLPNEKIMYISTNDEHEAYYLCGVLSSSLIANCVKSYMNPTSISAHVLDKLNIPDFDESNDEHMQIAKICREGHGKKDISAYISEIDAIVSKMYR